METSKLKEAIAEAEAQAAKYRRLADDLRAALERANSSYVVQPRLNLQRKDEPKSTLRTAVAILEEKRQPMRVADLVKIVTERRGKDTPRASLESVLSTAIKEGKFNLKRTGPGTYGIER